MLLIDAAPTHRIHRSSPQTTAGWKDVSMFRRLTPFALSAVLAVVLSLAGRTPAHSQAGQPAAYALTDLGAIASGPSTAADISPAGNVTGGVVVSAGTAAALWTPGSGGYTF